MKRIVIASAVRTPMGSFMGKLSGVSATQLGATVIKAAVERAGISANQVEEVFMGNVLSAGVGQAPARQAAITAGLPNTVPCTTVNKVCSSGLKSVMLGAQAVALGDADIVVAGGMENMSQAPHILPNSRLGTKFGNAKLLDTMVNDGLTDAYDKVLMGECAEVCAEEHNFSREDQDTFAIESYTRAQNAWEAGKFKDEIVPVEVPQRRGDALVVDTDEEFNNVKFEKIPALRPAFKKEGTVTAANASTINDGAAAFVLMSEEKAKELGIKPLAYINSYADTAHDPVWFTTAPEKAVRKAVEKAGLDLKDVDYFELNEAFSVVGLANTKLLNIEADKVNVNGGAVALGHPLGASGARILVTLVHVLKQNNAKIGAAGICNGGGGASAVILENV